MPDQTDHLKSLGRGQTLYQYDEPNASVLETFPNPTTSHPYVIHLETKEFTSLCPKTGQPDYGSIEITYIPKERCVETKSLKLYLMSYRNHGAFMENLSTKIYRDLRDLLDPFMLQVEASFASRGGIKLVVTCQHDDREPYKGTEIKQEACH